MEVNSTLPSNHLGASLPYQVYPHSAHAPDSIGAPLETTTTSNPSNPKKRKVDQEDGTGGTGSGKEKQKRNRQQLSCTECHRRKQSCDRQIPCSRCLKRGIGELCRVASANTDFVPGGAGNISTTNIGSPNRFENAEMRELNAKLDRLKNFIKSQMPPEWDADKMLEMAERGHGTRERKVDDEERSIADQGENRNDESTMNVYQAEESSEKSDLPVSMKYPELASPSPALPPDRTGSRYPSHANAFSLLCEKSVCDYLVQKFYEIEFIQWTFTIAHRPSFENSYNAMWEWGLKEKEGLNNPDESPPFTLSFAALLYIMLATALQFFPLNPSPPPPRRLPSLTKIGKTLYQASRDFLVKSEIEESPDVARIEALLGVALFLQNEGRPGDNYTLTGQAIRLAQSMCMHREVSKKCELSAFESEARRRLWWCLYTYDRFQNLAFGRPYVISDMHCDVKRPANCDILDLTEDGPTNIQPIDEPTEFTYHLLNIDLAKLSGEILDKCFAPRGASYQTIIDMDSKLAQLEDNIPKGFKSPSPDMMAKRPYLHIQHQLFLLEINWTRALLHRPYLLKKLGTSKEDEGSFKASRLAAINFSKKCISIRRDLDPDIPKHYTKWFLLGFNVFDATANLCMAIHQDLSNISRIKELDTWVMHGREMLVSMRNTNACAPQGIEAIDAMRSKYLEILRNRRSSGLLDLSIPYFGVSIGPMSDVPRISNSPISQNTSPTFKEPTLSLTDKVISQAFESPSTNTQLIKDFVTAHKNISASNPNNTNAANSGAESIPAAADTGTSTDSGVAISSPIHNLFSSVRGIDGSSSTTNANVSTTDWPFDPGMFEHLGNLNICFDPIWPNRQRPNGRNGTRRQGEGAWPDSDVVNNAVDGDAARRQMSAEDWQRIISSL